MKKLLAIFLAMVFIFGFACCKHSEQVSDANLKSAIIVSDDMKKEISRDCEAFSLALDDNTSLQSSMELSGKNLYWQIEIENTGNSGIIVEIEGDTHKVEAGNTAVIYSTGPWSAGTYMVSFAGGLPDTMQGRAVCYITDGLNEITR